MTILDTNSTTDNLVVKKHLFSDRKKEYTAEEMRQLLLPIIRRKTSCQDAEK